MPRIGEKCGDGRRLVRVDGVLATHGLGFAARDSVDVSEPARHFGGYWQLLALPGYA
jgi:hypothetical protein